MCLFFPCLKSRARVLNFYHFLNHTSSIEIVKGVSSKVLHRKQFPPLFSQESDLRILITKRELFSAVKESKQSSIYFKNFKHTNILEHCHYMRLHSAEESTLLFGLTQHLLLQLLNININFSQNRQNVRGGPNIKTHAGATLKVTENS